MKRHALFVGVNDYADNAFKKLRYSLSDAVALSGAFAARGFDVEVLSNPKADAVLAAVERKAAVAEAAPFPVHGDRTESLRVIREVFCAPESYAIVSSADGGLLGCINVFPGAKGEDVYRTTTVKIGYWLGKPFWGRGFMTEAVTALCSRCFHSGRFNCERIIGLTSPGNLGSRRVMEKSGFRLVEANDNVCRYVLEGR